MLGFVSRRGLNPLSCFPLTLFGVQGAKPPGRAKMAMAKNELLVIDRTYELLKWFLGKLEKFPRSHDANAPPHTGYLCRSRASCTESHNLRVGDSGAGFSSRVSFGRGDGTGAITRGSAVTRDAETLGETWAS